MCVRLGGTGGHLEDAVAELLVHAREGDDGIEGDPPGLLLLEVDGWGPPVETDAHALQLLCEDAPVRMRPACVQHHQQQIRALAHRYHLPPPPCASNAQSLLPSKVIWFCWQFKVPSKCRLEISKAQSHVKRSTRAARTPKCSTGSR